MESAATPSAGGMGGALAEVARAERDLQRATSARPQDPGQLAAALEAAVAVARRWPQAAEGFILSELLGELSEVYEQLERTEDALQAMRQAIVAGYRSWPDPRCRVAEILLRAGRAEEAHPIFDEVQVDTPGDVWLYNNAGLEYGHAGDHHRAVDWLTEGLDLAIRTGDPERLVAQMSELRRTSLAALGREADELEARVDAFLAQPRPARRAWSPAEVPAALAGLDRVAGSALAPDAAVPVPTDTGAGRSERAGRGVQLAFGWFPATEFSAALTAWPQLAQDWGTTEHTDYCWRLQRHLTDLAQASAAGPAWIVPLRVDELTAWCARTGHDPATGNARSSYAAERARTAADDVLAWPPPRNARCWCGSGRKYKQCCGHPAIMSPG